MARHSMNRSTINDKLKTTNRRFWVVMLSSLLIFLTIAVGGGLVFGEEKYYLVGFSLIILIIPAIYQIVSQDSELFSPMNLVFLNLFFGVFLQTLALCFLGEVNTNLFLDPLNDFNTIMVGMVAIAVAVLFLVIGYSYYPRGNSMSRASHHSISVVELIAGWSRKKVILLAVIFGFVTLLSFLYFATTIGLFENISRFSVKRNNIQDEGLGLARFGMRFAQVACILVFAYHIACSRVGIKSGVLFIVFTLFLLAIAGPFVSSSRSLLLYFVVAMFVVHHFVSGGWRARQMYIAIIMVVAVVVAMGMLRYVQQRSVTYVDYSQDIGVAKSVGRIATSNNFLGIKKTSVLIDLVPDQVPHAYGSTYLLWLVAPIPRAFWADKPTVRIGGVLGSKIYGTRDTNGIPPGFVGESYYNFGWFGIPLVAVLFGVGIRRFYEYSGKRGYSSSSSLLIYAVLFAPVGFASLSSDFTGFVSRVVQILIPLVFAMSIVGIRKRDAKLRRG